MIEMLLQGPAPPVTTALPAPIISNPSMVTLFACILNVPFRMASPPERDGFGFTPNCAPRMVSGLLTVTTSL